MAISFVMGMAFMAVNYNENITHNTDVEVYRNVVKDLNPIYWERECQEVGGHYNWDDGEYLVVRSLFEKEEASLYIECSNGVIARRSIKFNLQMQVEKAM